MQGTCLQVPPAAVGVVVDHALEGVREVGGGAGEAGGAGGLVVEGAVADAGAVPVAEVGIVPAARVEVPGGLRVMLGEGGRVSGE
ncbi:MAG: hypothetical protein IJR99_08105 [Kiritimatiellae bacterium]|nr:hypothetical protein [Kiritimatiellia bacterium]